MVKFLKYIYGLFFIIIISCGGNNKIYDCSKFKKGKFYIKRKLDNSYWIIERNDSIQTETNSKTGNKVTSKITWTSPCEYELYYQKEKMYSNDSVDNFIKSRPIKR